MNPIKLAVEDVIHLKFWNPNDPIAGMAPATAGKIPILSLYKAQSYNYQFFENGAMPGAVFETEKQLGDKTFNRLKDQLQGEHRVSTGKSHKWMILEQGLKMVQRGVTQKDMDFLGLQRLSGEEIMQIFGMKKSIISVTEDLNFATAKEERKSWWQDTCRPLMRIIEDMLQFGLGIELLFDVSVIEALHESFSDKAKTCESLMRLGFTRNEVNKRLEMGFAEVPWGDIAYMPVNMMAVNLPGTDIPTPDDIADPNADENPPEEDDDDDLEGPPDETDADPTPDEGGNTRSVSPELKRHLEGRWKSQIDAIQPFENMGHKKVRKVLYAMRKKTLDAITKGGLDGALNISFHEEANSLIKELNPVLANAMRLGISMMLEDYKSVADNNKDYSFDDTVVITDYLKSNELLIRGIPERIRLQVLGRIQTVLSENAGSKFDEVADMIQHSVREVFNVSQARSRTIARTEIMGAFNHARSERMVRFADETLQKAWITVRDGHDRVNHMLMAGRIIGAKEMWILPDGAMMRYPGDPAGGARNRCNCRCMEILLGG